MDNDNDQRARHRVADDATIRAYISDFHRVRGLVDSLPDRDDGPQAAMGQLLAALASIWRDTREDWVLHADGWVPACVRSLAEALDRATDEQRRELMGVITALGGDAYAIAGLHPTRATLGQIAAALRRPVQAPGGLVYDQTARVVPTPRAAGFILVLAQRIGQGGLVDALGAAARLAWLQAAIGSGAVGDWRSTAMLLSQATASGDSHTLLQVERDLYRPRS